MRKKLRGRRGLTLAETLVALAVFAILSVALVVGTTAAWKVYQKAMVASEARTLQSTLTQSIGDELRYAKNIQANGRFDSESFGKDVSVSSADGKVKVGSHQLLPAKAYTKGLKAEVTVTYDQGNFTVELTISHPLLPEGGYETQLMIRALNAPPAAEP